MKLKVKYKKEKIQVLHILIGTPGKWDPGPGRSAGGTPELGTRDPKMFRGDPRLGTPKY